MADFTAYISEEQDKTPPMHFVVYRDGVLKREYDTPRGFQWDRYFSDKSASIRWAEGKVHARLSTLNGQTELHSGAYTVAESQDQN